MANIDSKDVSTNDLKKEYYEKLIEQFGAECFKHLFDIDDSGNITIIKPQQTVPWAVIHFVQQLQINQRLRINDRVISELREAVERMQKEIGDLRNNVQFKIWS